MTSIWHRALARTAARLLSVETAGRLSIMLFHRVLPNPVPSPFADLDARVFDALMMRVRDWFNPLSLEEALRRLQDGTLPPRSVCVTFDDGYADTLTVAWPILKRLEIPAAVFVASGFLDGGIMWNDRVIEAVSRCPGDRLDLTDLGLGIHLLADPAQRTQVATELLATLKYRPAGERDGLSREIAVRHAADMTSPMLTRGQLRQLHAEGVEIGGHTVNHTILAWTEEHIAREEVVANKEELEALLGERIKYFAYPNGRAGRDFTPIHARIVQEAGYQAAVTTEPGVSTAATDRYWLRRFTPWDQTPLRFGVRLLRNMREAA